MTRQPFLGHPGLVSKPSFLRSLDLEKLDITGFTSFTAVYFDSKCYGVNFAKIPSLLIVL